VNNVRALAMEIASTTEALNIDQMDFKNPYFLVLGQRVDHAVRFAVRHDGRRSGWRCEGDAG